MVALTAVVAATGCSTTLPSPSASPSPMAEPNASAANVTPSPVEPPPLPTPSAGDVFVGFPVVVGPYTYSLFQFDAVGSITATLPITFGGFSHSEVQLVTTNSGRYWEQMTGALAGWSFRYGRSGAPFQIRKVYRATGGSLRAIVVSVNEL